MKRILGLWNLVRVALILFCGWQLGMAVRALQDAERILASAPYSSATQRVHADPSGTMEEADGVIDAEERLPHAYGGSSLRYVGLLLILALTPYATVRDDEPRAVA